jgi:hypothetical protein
MRPIGSNIPAQKRSSERVAKKIRDADHVDHEQRNPLEIDDENLAGQCTGGKEGRPDEEDLDDQDG